jgi:hypothetical protein
MVDLHTFYQALFQLVESFSNMRHRSPPETLPFIPGSDRGVIIVFSQFFLEGISALLAHKKKPGAGQIYLLNSSRRVNINRATTLKGASDGP